MTEKTVFLSSLSDKEFDACRFKRNEADPEKFEIWFMKFLEPEKCDFKPHPECDGVKYSVLLCVDSQEELGLYELEYYEAYFGNPLPFVKGSIRSGAEGMVIKHCKQGLKILLEMLEKYPQSTILKRVKEDMIAAS